MLTLSVKQNTINLDVYMGVATIVLKKNIPTINIYNDITTLQLFTYIDAGLYNGNSIPADAGLYSTASWDIVWAGGFA
jgi:hypothetical protein